MKNEINKNLISEVYGNTDQLKIQVIELNKTIDDLLKKQKDLKAAGEQNGKVYQDVAAQIRVAKDAIRETNIQIDTNIKTLNLSKNSLEQNRGLLKSLQQQYEQLTKSQGDNSTGAKALNMQIGTLSNTITQQEEKLEKSRKVFNAHKSTNEAFATSFDKLKTVSSDFGPSLEEASNGFNALKSGLSAVKTGFQSVGGAIKTTGFGLLILLLQSIVEYFTSTTEGAQKLKKILASIGAVVNVFKQGFATLGKLLIDAFSNPVESIKKLGNLLVENIFNRFKAILVIWDGIKNMDFKEISNGVIQAATGITHVVDKAVDAHGKVIEAKEKNEAIDKQLHGNNQKRHQQKIKMQQEEIEIFKQNNNSSKKNTNFLTQQLQDTANAFAQKAELEQGNYTAEQAALKNLLDNKLISLEQYHEESRQLEEKYHVSMGEIVKRMDAEELAKVQKQQQDLVNARQQKEVLDNDRQKINKAILPGSKLEAEKQLITDKYNFEIQKAAEAGKDTSDIRKQYEQEITDAAQRSEQQRKDFALQAAQQVSDKAFSILGNSIKSQSDAKIKGLETQKQAELSNSSLTTSQKKAIEDKYQKKEAAEKVKAFKAEQKASILQAVINGALAVTKATSQTGVLAPLVVPGIIAATAIQVATIAAQKAPQYAKGGLHYQSDGRGALLPGYSRTDNTNAYLRSGEAIVVSEAMRNPWARNLVSAINVAHGGRDFSAPNTGRGYAIGGIFTDGGNANRYYSQPVNDVKDLANTLAYQMINNFPPIYVDVKDVNNQQNILAQTVNRVNL